MYEENEYILVSSSLTEDCLTLVLKMKACSIWDVWAKVEQYWVFREKTKFRMRYREHVKRQCI